MPFDGPRSARLFRPLASHIVLAGRPAVRDRLLGSGVDIGAQFSCPTFAASHPRFRRILLLAGPAVLASTAYMDPGNYAVNIQAGASYGYQLLWVVLLANIVAMLFQALSAKLGIATGRNLAELCQEHYPTPIVWGMWGASELAVMATDLAEFLGGAIGFSLLFGMPLLSGMAITAIATCAILCFGRWGFRPIEIVLAGFVAVIGACYMAELTIVPVDWPAAGAGSFVPHLPDATAIALAAGIAGATVMPHALFLHSGLTQARVAARTQHERSLLVCFSNREVVVALAVAGAINAAIVLIAAASLGGGNGEYPTIASAYNVLGPLLGPAAAALFVISLIASGISSSVVGTMAGQIVMQGFARARIPLWVRRLVTIIPAFVVVGVGVRPEHAMVLSQILLSVALPVPMISLVLFTRRRDIMGPLVNRRLTDMAAIAATVLILGLDLILVIEAVFG